MSEYDIRKHVKWDEIPTLERAFIGGDDCPIGGGLIYLGTPYSHANKRIREMRYEKVTKVAGALVLDHKQLVFSPITHSHPMAVDRDESTDWNAWKSTCLHFLLSSRILLALDLPGWRESVGLAYEIWDARAREQPIYRLNSAEWLGVVRSRL